MKFTTTAQKLNECLKNVTPFSDKHQPLDSIKNLLLKVEGGTMEVFATNQEAEITQKIHGSGSKKGETTVPGQLLRGVVASLYTDTNGSKKPETLTLELDKNSLAVTCQSTKTLIRTTTPEYVRLPFEKKKKPLLKIQAKDLKHVLDQTVFAASKDVARPIIHGVLFHFLDGELYVVGCDAYRLAEKKVSSASIGISKKERDDTEALLPSRNLLKIIRLLGSCPGETVSLYQNKDEQQVAFVFGDGEIEVILNQTTKTDSGGYPDYRKLVPTEFKTEIVVSTRALMAAAARIGLFTHDPTPSVVLSWTTGKSGALEVKSVDSQMGGTEGSLSAKITAAKDAPTQTLALNTHHLKEALQVIETDEVQLNLNDRLEPCLLFNKHSGKQTSEYRHLLMPMRT